MLPYSEGIYTCVCVGGGVNEDRNRRGRMRKGLISLQSWPGVVWSAVTAVRTPK